MNEISKYISLKQYVPIGTPEISNFELKSEEIKILPKASTICMKIHLLINI